jgi:hypothetical protein
VSEEIEFVAEKDWARLDEQCLISGVRKADFHGSIEHQLHFLDTLRHRPKVRGFCPREMMLHIEAQAWQTLVSLPAANKIARSKMIDVHALLMNGGLNNVALDKSQEGYLAIRVDPKEILEKRNYLIMEC